MTGIDNGSRVYVNSIYMYRCSYCRGKPISVVSKKPVAFVRMAVVFFKRNV